MRSPSKTPRLSLCGRNAPELGIPVLIHFGIQGSSGGIAWHQNINPLKLHNVAKFFPEVDFVVPHFGCAWERETLQLCWSCPNVSVDTSGSLQWIRWVPGDLTVKYLFRKYYESIGPEPHTLWFRFQLVPPRFCLSLSTRPDPRLS